LKILRRSAKVILILLLVGLVGGIFVYQSLKPDYDGVKALPGLQSEVSVYFDTYGIPHIYGDNESDVFRALGYVHAQDRLWQMELLRRVARGGLSEVFGKELLPTDRFFLALGIWEASRETVAGIDPDREEMILAQAYLDGVNEFIKKGPTPVEFYLTGTGKTPFSLEDMYNSIGYMAFSFAMAHKTDPLLSAIRDSLGPAYLHDLEIGYDSLATRIRNYSPAGRDSVALGMGNAITEALSGLPLPQFIGSNSWVLAPGKTSQGKVILANDPHIGFAQPSVWYEAHLVSPGYEKYGFHLAGIPFPLLGHDRNLAYGLTMFENDDLDFYYEVNHPSDSTKYQLAGGWENYETRTHTIRVKDAEDVTFTYKSTRNGPLMNGIAAEINLERPVSMRWTYTRRQNRLMQVLYAMSHARGLGEFEAALPDLHAPGLNVMYGDAEGNIAWWAGAHLFKAGDSVNTKLIREHSVADDSIRFLDFSHNPKAINPPWNYVYSANNQPEPVGGFTAPGYYLPENRARRIVDVLESKDDWDLKSVSAMILDDTSPVNTEIVTDLAKAMDVTLLGEEELKLLDGLSRWQGNYPLKSIEATLFHRWVYFFLKNTFGDELGEGMFGQMLRTHFVKRLIAPMAARETSVWWDNIKTTEKIESKNDMIQLAFGEAVQSLRDQLGDDYKLWTWDRVHTLEHQHPIGRVAALRSFFNVGPFPVRGSREVINNMAFSYEENGENHVNSGPSTRRVIDFSDIEQSLGILPTGQSGNPLSPHYEDQAELYIHGKFRKMLLNREEIISTSNSLLIFKKQ